MADAVVVVVISEVEVVVEDAVGDVADSMMTVEGTEFVIQDGVIELVVVVVGVVRAVLVSHSNLKFFFAYSLT